MSTPFRVRPTLWGLARSVAFELAHSREKRYECPACFFHGPFATAFASTGVRVQAICPRCGALERHRLQILVTRRIFERSATRRMRMLHFAPEPFFRPVFSREFERYETADFSMPGVDFRVDLQQLPFAASSYDVIFASHVLEHIRDDLAAICEIRRVLSPGGVAILPVPLVCEKTIEYPHPNPDESFHVRAPGPDYFERFAEHFSRVELISSSVFPAKHQLHILESRMDFPNPRAPLRTPMAGSRHEDVVPVCHV